MSYTQSIYGPRLGEYLSSRRLGVAISGRVPGALPDEHKIEAAIDSLGSSNNVGCETFETILSMEHSPACGYLYLLLSDVGVFPSCIRLLRAYCREGRSILDHAYGYLCLQVMALSVDVAKLNQVEQLDVVLPNLTRLSSHVPVSDLLNDYSREWESREFCKEVYLRPSPRLLGWHIDPQTRLETCLARIGGCNIQDVQFLLEQLWPARSALLEVSEYASNSFPGWCGLFYVMHNTLVKAFGDLTRRRETPEQKTYWTHLAELLPRYALGCKRSEDPTIGFLMRDCPQFADHYGTTVATPPEADRIVKAYTDKMTRLPTFVYAYVVRLYGFVCANYHVSTPKSDKHLIRISAATLEESWAELLRANLLSAGQWYQFTNTIVTNSTHLMMSPNHTINKPLLLSILTANEDFFDFLGRLFLFPMSVEGGSIGRNRHLEWESHSLENFSMFGQLLRIRLANDSFEPTPNLTASWSKIYDCFQFQKNMSTKEDRYKQEYAKTWITAWLKVGLPLDLVRSMDTAKRCHYARCAVPDTRSPYLCTGCNTKLYCSRRCYQADWVDPQSAHRITCAGTLPDDLAGCLHLLRHEAIYRGSEE